MPTNTQKKLNFCQKSILLNESAPSRRFKENSRKTVQPRHQSFAH